MVTEMLGEPTCSWPQRGPGYCFCIATIAQTARDWLGATAQALTFYGEVPRSSGQLVRALVTAADRYEPVLTEAVRDIARHYGCSVLPGRARHPPEKLKVALSVLLVSVEFWRACANSSSPAGSR